MRLLGSTIALLLYTVAASAQTPTIKNFDTILSQDNANVVIQPPAGKTWTLLRGSFVLDKALPGSAVTIFEQDGEEEGLCTNLIHADLATNTWIPIVGGHVSDPRRGYAAGETSPIVLPYPHRLVIHIHNLKHPATMPSYTRFTIIESASH